MGKRYKCPYCDKRDERSNLITHIKKSHKELIPEGFSAERVVYNSVNKVSCGRCRICGKETPWNQKAGRYDVLCGDPKCKEYMREEYKKNMLRVRGTYNILNDPEQQTKMLANRKISGSYKFSDGGVVSYTGSYEKKCLEFMDVVMQIPSKDILSPGPTLEYEYNGKKHFYISDFYYIPYNLIIEVKDGGEDPNTKDSTSMRASREKTIAKEKIITDRGEYNYLRLTNNNFSQLIEIFMDIKLKLLEGDTSKTYKINEAYSATDIMATYASAPLAFIPGLPKSISNSDKRKLDKLIIQKGVELDKEYKKSLKGISNEEYEAIGPFRHASFIYRNYNYDIFFAEMVKRNNLDLSDRLNGRIFLYNLDYEKGDTLYYFQTVILMIKGKVRNIYLIQDVKKYCDMKLISIINDDVYQHKQQYGLITRGVQKIKNRYDESAVSESAISETSIIEKIKNYISPKDVKFVVKNATMKDIGDWFNTEAVFVEFPDCKGDFYSNEELQKIANYIYFKNRGFKGKEPVIFYKVKCSDLNKKFKLRTEEGMFDDDQLSLAISGEQFKNIKYAKDPIGGRWFTDVIDNAIYRETGHWPFEESAMLEVFSYPCELSSKGTGAIHPMLKTFVEAMRKRYNTKTKNIDIIFLKSYQTLVNTINKYEDVFQFKNDFMVRIKDTIYIVDPVIFTNRNSSTRYYAGETETYYAVLRWQLCNILLTEYTDISNLRTINAISMYEAGINSDNYTLSSAQVRDLNKIKRIADIDGYKSLPAIVSNRKSIVESAITEGVLIDKKDIYYNKQAFDDGRINLCFITGHSGSGKTTMAKNMPGDMVELDDVIHNYNFSDDNLKEYCDLIYSFFNGVGKKYRVHSWDELLELLKSDDDYEERITRDFVRYAIAYANSHRDKKFVLEGIWIYLFIKPSELDNYAVYIKGTSAMKSNIRACNRDNDTTMGKLYQYFADNKRYRYGESKINAYRKYFEHKKSSI